MQRSTRSAVLGGAHVFPGGKLEHIDSADATLAKLDQTPTELHQALHERELDPRKAAGLFVAAIRETAEEVGVFLCAGKGGDGAALEDASQTFARLRERAGTTLLASALAPWSRWITPRHTTSIERRFDTRFFLAALPAGQDVSKDGVEATAARWWTPQQALAAYYQRQIDLIPPQIISLFHLTLYADVDQAMAAARAHGPVLIEPHLFKDEGVLTMCYPGDSRHALQEPAFPAAVPTRLSVLQGRFVPPEGVPAWAA